MPNPNHSSAANKANFGPVYRRIVRDENVSHGAFRLWHLLLDFMNKEKLRAWPSQKTIAAALHCKPHSLKQWTGQLAAGGYLRAVRTGRDHHFTYDMTPNSPASGSAGALGIRRDAPSGIVVMPKRASRRDAQLGIQTEPIEPNSRTELKSARGFDVKGLVGGLVSKMAVRQLQAPTIDEVKLEMEKQFCGAGQFADSFIRTMEKSGWRDRANKPVREWRLMCRRYASAAFVRIKSKESL